MIAWSVYSVGGFSSMLGRFKSHTKPPMNPWSMPAYLLENLVMENAPVCGWLKMGVPISEISMISRGKITKVGAPERDHNFQRNDKAWIQLGLGIPGDTVSIAKQYRTPSQPMVTLGLQKRAAHLHHLGPKTGPKRSMAIFHGDDWPPGIPWYTYFWRMPNLSWHVGSLVQFWKVAMRMFVQQGCGAAMSPVMIWALALPSFSRGYNL